MKVLKFGGTSVGSVESLRNVKKIVEGCSEPVVVAVSALGGITDKLLKTASLAMSGDEAYLQSMEEIVARHHSVVEDLIPSGAERSALLDRIDALFSELDSIFHGVFLIRDLSEKTSNTIVSYGERLSSDICSVMIDGAVLHDSREFIKTVRKQGRNLLATEATNELIKAEFSGLGKSEQISLVPGFISRDINSGEVTNLGRGGSDYTASIIAAALDADSLEIWTDVDGFMTADPRIIKTAYTIDSLTYLEAMELCNFGAKVVYPPTIYPACAKNIPILIKNTFRPEVKGTVISNESVAVKGRPIKGISSISNTSIITVAGLSMVGVIGVNKRIFSALAENGISVFLVSQASSENNTSIGVKDEDGELACQVLNEEFAKEIQTGAMYPMSIQSGLATIAVVGENMRHTPGISGKLYGALGRSGISVIACAQGAAETNISFVVDGKWLRKSLNVIHDSFFLSEYQVINIFLCGIGTVGGNLIEQIASQRQNLMDTRNLQLNVVGIANSRHAIFDRDGLELDGYKERLMASEPCNFQKYKEEILAMNIYNSVFVDCTASAEVSGAYFDFLDHNVNVVAANKIAASSEYANYAKLKETAHKRGVKFLFETNVGAGLPIINTINSLRDSGDRILKIEAVLSGTLNFIFNTISADIPFSKTVQMAKEEGYSEPDPRIDLCGKDVIRKLVILSRESGYMMEQEDVEKHLFVPDELFAGSLENFWERLPELDADFEARRQKLEAENKCWRFVAKLEDGKGSVQLREIPQGHSFYKLEGSNNIILLTTERYKQYPMLIQGYGAGASVTAAGVFGDIMNIANV
ncbi:MAG: bifunctional aspartate kinase/homoserine dehydrogenase I [Bacteroidales bacterium]|nr:bifunctional aspartate kinase/homoserine dehydrogenase I [Candidatus Cryptobacteroides caccocaballi]